MSVKFHLGMQPEDVARASRPWLNTDVARLSIRGRPAAPAARLPPFAANHGTSSTTLLADLGWTPERKQAMYERFTDRARKVMQLANQEAQRFNHEYIGTEHILLGLVKEGTGV